MSDEALQIIHCVDLDGEVNTFNTEEREKTFKEIGNIPRPSVITELEKPHDCEEFEQQTRVVEQLQMHSSSSKYTKLHKAQNCCEEVPYKSGTEYGKPFIGNFCKQKHAQNHVEENPPICNKSGKAVVDRDHDMLDTRKRNPTGNYQNNSKKCMKEATSGNVNNKSKKRSLFKCGECGKQFSSNYHGKNHLRIHTGECPLKCAECGEVFATASALNHHMLVHTRMSFVCDQPNCHYVCYQKHILAAHKRAKHSGEQSFKCVECGVAFVHQPERDVHNSKNPKCALCITKHVLQFQKHENNGGKSLTCCDCLQMFGSHAAYRVHLRKHTQNYPVQCDQLNCTYKCRRLHELENHKRSKHTGERPFTCGECGKGFPSKLYRNVHMRIHTGERPFKCTVCGEAFITNSSLKNHMCIHTGNYPLICDYPECNFKSTNNFNLRQHKLCKHSAKTFVCDCGKVFADSTKLDVHKHKHSENTPCMRKQPKGNITHTSKSSAAKYSHNQHNWEARLYRECNKILVSKRSKRLASALSHTSNHAVVSNRLNCSFACTQKPIVTANEHTGHLEGRSFICSECGVAFVHEAEHDVHKLEHAENVLFMCKEPKSNCMCTTKSSATNYEHIEHTVDLESAVDQKDLSKLDLQVPPVYGLSHSAKYSNSLVKESVEQNTPYAELGDVECVDSCERQINPSSHNFETNVGLVKENIGKQILSIAELIHLHDIKSETL